MAKVLLLLLAFCGTLGLSSCKNNSTDPEDHSTGNGCGDGLNPDSSTHFTLLDSPFGDLGWDSIWISSHGFHQGYDKQTGELLTTISAGFVIRMDYPGKYFSFGLHVPGWKSGKYSWQNLSSTTTGVGARLYFYWQDTITGTTAIHAFHSVSGGTTINVDGEISIKDPWAIWGTFCGVLKDSLDNTIRIENGRIFEGKS